MDFFSHVRGLAAVSPDKIRPRTDVYGLGDWRLNSTTRPNDVWAGHQTIAFRQAAGGFAVRGPTDFHAMTKKCYG
jgi:hypothetical protein